MTEQLEYGPFGELLRISGSAPDSTPFGYSTKYTDGESGLVYYGNRIYSPKIGSWSSRDPMGDLVCHNLYQFVFGDPISFVDVLGFDGQRFGGPRIRPPAYQGGARGAGPAPRSPMVLEPLIPYPDGTQPAVMQVVGASISGFSQLCKSEGHCPCPNWGNIWIIMTLGQTSYKGCVGQTKDAAAALQKLAATGFGGEYSLIWMYRWQPLPHNWLVLAPGPGSDVPRIVVDYWKGIIEVEYPRRTMFVSLSCNPFQYQVGFRPTQ
jgi:RHS repeat-associated protein